MKDLKFKYLMGLFLLFVLSSNSRVKYDAERIIQQEFYVTPSSLLKIKNEYGNLEIKTWTKNIISFEIKIQAESNDESLAEKLVSESDVKIEQIQNKVIAISKLKKINSNPSWWKFWANNKHSLNIHYTVFIPQETDLELKNAYGNIYCEEVHGQLNADLQYGKLTTYNTTGTVKLNLKHAEASLGECGNTEINTQYSEIKLKKAGMLKINSTHSEMFINECLDANIYSRYDQYKIGKADNLYNEGSFDEIAVQSVRSISMRSEYSELTVEKCEVSFDLNISHGEAIIEKTLPAFNKGILSGAYTDYSVTMNSPFSFDIRGNYTDIDLPAGIKIGEKKMENKISHYSGQSGHNPTCLLQANLNHGSLNVE